MPIPTHPARHIRFGEFQFDRQSGELRSSGHKSTLQEKPFQVLVALLERPGELVTRQQLKERLWPSDTFVDFDHGVNKAVNRLREALHDSADHPKYVETLARRGYRLMVPVEAVGRAVGQSTWSDKAEPELRIVGSTATSRRSRNYWSAIVLTVIALAAGSLGYSRWSSRSRPISLENLQIRKLTDNGRSEDVAISPDGRYVAYATHRGEKYSLLLRQLATQSEIAILPPDGGSFHGITFSPDGSYLYFVRADENDPYFKYLYRMPALGGAVRRLITDVDSPVSFSPDGQRIVYEHNNLVHNEIELMIAKEDGSLATTLATFHNASGYMYDPGPSWSPDGRTIALPVMLLEHPFRWVMYMVTVSDGQTRELHSGTEEMGRPGWLSAATLLFPRYDPVLGRRQLWIISFPAGEARRFTRDLVDYGNELEVSRDGAEVVTITRSARSNLWMASAESPSESRQLTFDDSALLSVAELPDRRLLGMGDGDKLWILNPEGAKKTPLGDIHNVVGWATPCGTSVVFISSENGIQSLIRVQADGTHLVKLISGLVRAPACSPNGKWVYYTDLARAQKIWRIPIEGGDPVKVGGTLPDSINRWLSLSPDGKFLAYTSTHYADTSAPGWTMVVETAEGGLPFRQFKLPGEFRCPHWSPSGNALQYVLTQNGAGNIWEQPLSGAPPRQLTRFTSGQIFDFNWSSSERRFLVTRGEVSSNVVLLSGFR